MTGVLNADQGVMMKNPRRERCDIDASFIAAYASVNDCPMVATLCIGSEATIGQVLKVYLPLEPTEMPKILPYAYLVCMSKYNHCINSISLDNLVYVLKEKDSIIVVLDDEKDYANLIKCLQVRTNNVRNRVLCLNEISELKEHIECITQPKSNSAQRN